MYDESSQQSDLFDISSIDDIGGDGAVDGGDNGGGGDSGVDKSGIGFVSSTEIELINRCRSVEYLKQKVTLKKRITTKFTCGNEEDP